MILILSLAVIWIFYAILDGFIQAHYYSLYPTDKGHKNIHWAYVIQRLLLLGCIYGTLDGRIFIWDNIIFIFSLIFIFSFFHNGSYYATRNKFEPDKYKKKWMANSETSQAFFEFDFTWRTGMCLIGILFIIGILLEK